MNKATRATVSVFGVLAGLTGIEHGIGEILQGNKAPDGVIIQSWPDSPWFAILAGEPAMTLVPNLLVTGILAILVSLIFLAWATLFVHRKNGGLVLILLSIVLLLVGGGFGLPLLGVILGVAATRIHAPLRWWREHLPVGSRRLLSKVWPWSLGAALTVWLLLLPGSILLNRFIGASNPDLVLAIVAFLPLAAFGLLFLTIVTAFARDTQPQTDVQPVAATPG